MGRPKGRTGKATVPNGMELKRLMTVAGTTRFGERDRLAVTLSYWLGLRAKELAALTVGDVYDDHGRTRQVLHLKASYTKREKARDVFLSAPEVIRRLEAYRDGKRLKPDTPLMRTRSGRAFTANGMVKLLGHVHMLAGIEKGSSHSGRRSMITNLAERGVDLKAIATLAGHASISTTAGYVQDNPARLARIMAEVTLKG